MGNFNNRLGLRTFELMFCCGNTLQSELTQLINNLDSDLEDNGEEYFREDTLKLGFKNEGERIVSEFIKSKGGDKAIWEVISEEEPPQRMHELLTELFEFAQDVNDNGFYLESSTYCKEYDMIVQETDDNEFQVILAYIY